MRSTARNRWKTKRLSELKGELELDVRRREGSDDCTTSLNSNQRHSYESHEDSIKTHELSSSTCKFKKETRHGQMVGLDDGKVRIPVLGLAVNRLEIIDSQQDRESTMTMRTR